MSRSFRGEGTIAPRRPSRSGSVLRRELGQRDRLECTIRDANRIALLEILEVGLHGALGLDPAQLVDPGADPLRRRLLPLHQSQPAHAAGHAQPAAGLTGREPGQTGADGVEFLIRPNPGLPFSPVAQTASGGELSRIALAIAVVAGGDTLVFDELDAGIGGETANAVAKALARAAETAQVITITHLPQIASRADRHFRVDKIPGDPTHTRITELGAAERRQELERMLGGAEFLATIGGTESG